MNTFNNSLNPQAAILRNSDRKKIYINIFKFKYTCVGNHCTQPLAKTHWQETPAAPEGPRLIDFIIHPNTLTDYCFAFYYSYI